MEKIFCRLCGSWLVYEAPQTGDEAVAEHRRINHPIIGHARAVVERDDIPAIRVTRELYDGNDSDSRRNRMAFSVSFPDGTGCWSHNTANVAARITEYRAAAKRAVDVDWRIGDVACPVQVDGTAKTDEIKQLSCGCCTNGCVCWMHKPDRRPPVVCDHHWIDGIHDQPRHGALTAGMPIARHPDPRGEG